MTEKPTGSIPMETPEAEDERYTAEINAYFSDARCMDIASKCLSNQGEHIDLADVAKRGSEIIPELGKLALRCYGQ